MQLTEEQVRIYEKDGFLLLPEYFSEEEIGVMRDELPGAFAEDSPRRVLEKESGMVRGVHGTHETQQVFSELVRLPRMLEPAKQLLGSDVYVHQFKINAKLALIGELWEWHQDYTFWRYEDGMPTTRAVSIVILLDEVNEFNGPMLFIPGSHRQGALDVGIREQSTQAYGGAPAWQNTLTADLKYTLSKETLVAAIEERGIVAPKGPAGSVLLFHSNVAHGSAPNMSPVNRTLVIVAYNSVENTLDSVASPRPEFIASRNFSALSPVPDNTLLAARQIQGR